jgi:ATP-binding cassette subfamily F protein 3
LEALNLNHTILEELSTAGTGKTEQELRNLLGCFLFSGDEVDKKIKVLSGGEKARVALAKVIASKSNFLLLDEPTNHLDIHSVELLSDALNRYEGSYILVSHDRFFISKTANKIWEIVDHEIKEFKGGYEEYVQWKERMKASQQSTVNSQPKETKQVNSTTEKKTQNSKLRTQNSNEIQKLQKQLKKLEEQINNISKEKSQIEENLAKPEFYSDKNKFLQLENNYKSVQQKLESANKDYESVFEKLIELEG